ncbi:MULTISPECIES: sigma-54 interaction domain-containing protein [Stenotrophomonas]|uniref:Fis family transcriptional regulator n=1 Tax=Stenotrophomonas nitritireducens TaxID=83617 RepID=A0ABR5NK15_9GAMM|nr:MULTISPECIES: sigma-54 dependent transcriptional regulator [Stenotrophomonas]KQO02764.1 Fis family transcriptional regulator [Stenotrophomonas sp. Leaf70]KRG57456.1 Fis family transcriptional regulator [Stenotrophomonas nitritireducens]
MSATPAPSRRCVIWFGTPHSTERALLASSGWHIRAVSPSQAGGVGMRSEDIVIGVLDFRTCSGSELAAAAEVATTYRHLPLLALLPPALDESDIPLRHALSSCRHRLSHPLDPAELLRQLASLQQASTPGGSDDALACLIGESGAMLAMRATLRKFAPVDLPVLVTGETGTGKEAAAHALHRLSPRNGHPFHAVNCGAIAPTLLQSELFGHERGAFTGATARRAGLFESAHRGTVFLDEIGDLPMEAQTSLLRVLQEGTIERIGNNQSIHVDVRVLAATHVDLEQAMEQGRFRSDLYYRLNVLRLTMPALRRREGDIELLAMHFLHEFRARHLIRARGYTPAARQALADFHWPGNVRELLNRVLRAAITTDNELIDCADLELSAPAETRTRLHDAHLRDERETLVACLARSHYNISACARLMKVSRVTVYRLCRKHRLQLQSLR